MRRSRLYTRPTTSLSLPTRIVLTLRDSGPRTAAELQDSFGLSPARLRDLLADLEARDILQVVQLPGGPVQHAFADEGRLVVAVHSGPSRVRVSVSDVRGRLHYRGTSPAVTATSLLQRVEDTVAAVRQHLDQAEVSLSEVWSVVFAVPTRIAPDGRPVPTPLISSWQGLDLRSLLAEALGCPVHLGEDGALSSIGQLAYGVGQLYRDFLNVVVDRRLCVRPIIDQRPFRGSHGLAGSVDHYFGEHVNTGGQLVWESGLDSGSVLEQALAGDPAAGREMSELATDLGTGIALAIEHYDPEAVVLGGEIGSCMGPWRADVARAVREQLGSPFELPEVHFSQLGGDSLLLGATVQALEEVGESLLGEPVPAPRLHGWACLG